MTARRKGPGPSTPDFSALLALEHDGDMMGGMFFLATRDGAARRSCSHCPRGCLIAATLLYLTLGSAGTSEGVVREFTLVVALTTAQACGEVGAARAEKLMRSVCLRAPHEFGSWSALSPEVQQIVRDFDDQLDAALTELAASVRAFARAEGPQVLGESDSCVCARVGNQGEY